MKIGENRSNRGAKCPIMSMLRLAKCWCIALLLLVFSGGIQPLAAHVVKQLYGEFAADPNSWKLEILFDAGYADPATRKELPARLD